jgi:cytochrome bd-type quinol oxidase subunit 2
MSTDAVILAALDPAGPFPAICGITWTFMAPTSGVSALVAAALCPFRRTARQAYRLSQAGLWTGIAAFLAALAGTLVTAGWEGVPKDTPGDAALLIVLTGIAPLLAFLTRRWSRRKMKAAESCQDVEPTIAPDAARPNHQ